MWRKLILGNRGGSARRRARCPCRGQPQACRPRSRSLRRQLSPAFPPRLRCSCFCSARSRSVSSSAASPPGPARANGGRWRGRKPARRVTGAARPTGWRRSLRASTPPPTAPACPPISNLMLHVRWTWAPGFHRVAPARSLKGRRNPHPRASRVSVKVKICGVRTPAIVEEAADAGADFVGLVLFAEEPAPYRTGRGPRPRRGRPRQDRHRRRHGRS